MSSGTTEVTESEILSRAIETIDGAHWNRIADVLSQLSLPRCDLDRADGLLEKNRAGTISDVERAELEKYLRVGNFLGLMRARALRQLGETSSA
jgi:hypothetical protein